MPADCSSWFPQSRSAACGKLSDRWIQAGASPTLVRKGMMLFGHTGIGIFLVLTVLAPGRLLTASLASTGVFLGISICNSWAIPQTLAGPRMVGRWVGVQNFAGNLGRRGCPRAHRISSGSDRFLLLAVLDYRRCGLDRRALLVVRGRFP